MSALAVGHRFGQPRPGLPRLPRAARGARRRPRRDRHRRRPVPTRPRQPGAAGRRRGASAALHGLGYDPGDEVLITAGATEALTAALLALLEPGDEVVLFEPMYDSYAAAVAMAGGDRPAGAAAAAGDGAGRGRSTPRSCGGRPPAHEAAAAQHPAQPDRQGLHPRRAGRDRRPGRRTRTSWSLTDEVYEHLVFAGRRALLDRDAARHARSARSWSAAPGRRST